jgi:two-component system LytT family response regulator
MTCVIIEDEAPATRRLAKLLEEAAPSITIVAKLEGIAESRAWFAAHPMPDLVLLDIHLADGSAFDLLKAVPIAAPIIFTTAYDAHALEAFKTSAVDYLLKPVKREELAGALRKLESLGKLLGAEKSESATEESAFKTRFALRIGERLHTLMVDDIAYFYAEAKGTYARTRDGRAWPMNHNLDALEGMLDPTRFFRINRQYLASIGAIAAMRAHTKARVVVTLQPPAKEQPVVSSERAAAFKEWLGK